MALWLIIVILAISYYFLINSYDIWVFSYYCFFYTENAQNSFSLLSLYSVLLFSFYIIILLILLILLNNNTNNKNTQTTIMTYINFVKKKYFFAESNPYLFLEIPILPFSFSVPVPVPVLVSVLPRRKPRERLLFRIKFDYHILIKLLFSTQISMKPS